MNGTEQAPRHDAYRMIHKALRACMMDTLTAVGNMDADDERDVAAVLPRVRELLDFCRRHLEHENTFVHTAMEARAPGSATAIADDHEHHESSIAELSAAIDAVEDSRNGARAVAAHALYRRLADFVGENFQHMDVEETKHNGVLWSHYSDEEILAIEHAIVASQTPEEAMRVLRWMVAAASPAERAGLLGAVRTMVPPEAFQGILEMARSLVPTAAYDKLTRALAAPVLAA
jgi:hemerythrin-like domain-containing protein